MDCLFLIFLLCWQWVGSLPNVETYDIALAVGLLREKTTVHGGGVCQVGSSHSDVLRDPNSVFP